VLRLAGSREDGTPVAAAFRGTSSRLAKSDTAAGPRSLRGVVIVILLRLLGVY
jgi:hypothetical protein